VGTEQEIAFMRSSSSAFGRLGFASVALLLLIAPAQPQPANEPVSFAGKQIKILIGFSPTGFGYDTYGRMLARHMGKYLPGNPTLGPQNRPGAGSLNLANYLYNAAPKDGTEIAIVGRGVAMEPLLGGGASQAKFNSTKFVWLGSMNNEVSGLYSPTRTGRHPTGDHGRQEPAGGVDRCRR
jgi:tripartite-type tricarboxylate transporter receptor subunit TctC